MTDAERLTLRARQILDDPTLSQNQRVANPQALLRALWQATQTPDARASMLAEITDLTVRTEMQNALEFLDAAA